QMAQARPTAAAARSQRPAGQPSGADTAGGDVARHVAEAFAHDLDHTAPGLTTAPAGPMPGPQPATVAAELAMALRSPATLRQLILLREVLDRPTERW
ncbi:MAG: hypothetical protein ACK5SI_06120, partial [Planctomycetia bacterium]